jgi:hypothetical protein
MNNWKKAVIGIIPAFLVIVALHGCSKKVVPQLPQGPQTLTGVLVPVPLSLVRRGTHELMQNGAPVYYAESSTLDLRNFEGMDAVFQGALELNTDPTDLPVLVISGATLIALPVHTWTVPALHLTLDAPDAWSATQFNDGAQFTQSGSLQVLLSVHSSPLTQLPDGVLENVAGNRAVEVTGTGGQIVYIQHGRDILVVRLEQAATDTLSDQVLNHIIHSIHFTQDTNSSFSSQAPASSSGGSVPTGIPCGGPAGILCPQGQYCEVTDRATNIGHCKALQH